MPFGLWGRAIEEWIAGTDWHGQRPAWGAAVLAALLAVDPLLPIPSSAVSTLLGALLGAATGTLIGAAAMTVGVLFGYLIGRAGGGMLPASLVRGPEMHSVLRWLDERGPIALALCRPVPVVAEASVIAAGLAGLRLRAVLIPTALSNLGISAVYAGLGSLAAGPGTFILAIVASLALPGLLMVRGRRRSARP